MQITDAAGVIQSNYVYGLGLLESIDAANNPLYFHFDAQHNTIGIADQSGVIKDTYTYDPFGTMLNHSGTTTQPFSFLGEYGVEQESSSLYYVRARYYDAANGRFLSKDVYPFDLTNPQTVNRYVYGLNNPSLNYDPLGLFSWTSLGVAGLQFLQGLGDLAITTLTLYTAAASDPGAVLSAGSSLNQATKDFQAYYANFENAINSNDNWVSTDNFTGVLDFVYNNPTVSAINDAATVISGIQAVSELLNSPSIIKAIVSSNYSQKQISEFLLNYLLGKNSPLLNVSDVRDAILTFLDRANSSQPSKGSANTTTNNNNNCK